MDATKPTDVEIAGAIPAYIREVRAAVNALSGGGDVGVTELTIAAGAVALTVGTDLGLYGAEIVIVDADGAVSIATITGGVQGQVKIFIFQDNNVSFVDGLASNGHIYLNQLPVLSTFAAQQNDVLALVNIGGDGSSVQGYWKEIFRQIALK
jgi:hypothetical protein